ncbi:hypothetical protein [Falsirhodobacter algicola]|uniref:Uncharacterized protein n=1 Tax=Falsirhodobacter algicola TaxID=2692330 RepID=A0A8J8SK13_9RHOB|nr:hypothetical protein [Falsirhodobacter algicola]QUS34993.1 hypothetical protein GR316_01100 [Falsirhodobacter algicola]
MSRQVFNILAIGQAGRLEAEAALLAASLRHSDPDFPGTLYIAEPQPGPLWPEDPRMSDAGRAYLEGLGAVILPFESRIFGAAYPNGNKIEALAALPDAPFLFLDTDTLITGSFADVQFDFARPSASMKRENTWPQEELYGPTTGQTWRALYDHFGVPFAPTLAEDEPEDHWERYLYFNAGWFFHQSPAAFGERYADWARRVWHDRPEVLECQPIFPWLDQIVLPLVIASFGGGRPGPELDGMDGRVTCHWRLMPLLYAREEDRVVEVLHKVTKDNHLKKVLKAWPAMRKMIYQGQGDEVRALFDRRALPRKEQALRNAIKRAGLWTR